MDTSKILSLFKIIESTVQHGTSFTKIKEAATNELLKIQDSMSVGGEDEDPDAGFHPTADGGVADDEDEPAINRRF